MKTLLFLILAGSLSAAELPLGWARVSVTMNPTQTMFAALAYRPKTAGEPGFGGRR